MRAEMHDAIDGRVLKCYEIVKKMGKGAYGQVWKAKDKKTSTFCALKKLYDAFRSPTDAKRAYRQIRYLQKFDHPNIIKMFGYYCPSNSTDIYLALQLMEADLCRALKNGLLKQLHKHYIFYQVVNAVHYMHSGRLMHRDLKPSNILINENCQVKLCDFGLIRSSLISQQGHYQPLTQNIATRWYRAPEVLLCQRHYTKAIDVWSLGCILAELFLGRPLFKGSSTISQLQKIFEVIGKPTREELDKFVKSQSSKSIVESMSVPETRTLTQIFPGADDSFIDLLSRTIRLNPQQRISIEEMVVHPYLKKFKNKTDENKPHYPMTIPYESKKLSTDEIRQLLLTPSSSDLDKNSTGVKQSDIIMPSERSTAYQTIITQSMPNRRNFFLQQANPEHQSKQSSPPKNESNFSREKLYEMYPLTRTFSNPNPLQDPNYLTELKLIKKNSSPCSSPFSPLDPTTSTFEIQQEKTNQFIKQANTKVHQVQEQKAVSPFSRLTFLTPKRQTSFENKKHNSFSRSPLHRNLTPTRPVNPVFNTVNGSAGRLMLKELCGRRRQSPEKRSPEKTPVKKPYEEGKSQQKTSGYINRGIVRSRSPILKHYQSSEGICRNRMRGFPMPSSKPPSPPKPRSPPIGGGLMMGGKPPSPEKLKKEEQNRNNAVLHFRRENPYQVRR